LPFFKTHQEKRENEHLKWELLLAADIFMKPHFKRKLGAILPESEVF